MTYTMFDDANVGEFAGLGDQYCYAGYVDGYVTFPWLQANRSHARRLVSISIHGRNADALDIENGAASVGMAPGWYRAQKARGLKMPILYCASGTSSSVLATMASAGISRKNFKLWSAHIGRGEHICAPGVCGYPAADGTQWTWTALGRSLDQSVLDDSFFAGSGGGGNNPPPPQHKRRSFVSLEGPMLLNHGAGTTTPVAFPVGARWLRFVSAAPPSDPVVLHVAIEGTKGVKVIKVHNDAAYTFKVTDKNVGARVFRPSDGNPDAPVSVSVS